MNPSFQRSVSAAIFLCVAILKFTSGQTMPEPARCCQPRQWQGMLRGVGGSVFELTKNYVFMDHTAFFAIDYDRKKTWLETSFKDMSGKQIIVKTLMDYNLDKQYMYQNGQCTITRIGEAMAEPCIPADDTFIGQGQLGFGPNSMTVMTWLTKVPNSDRVYKRVYTKDNCYPVAEALHGTNYTRGNLVQVVDQFVPTILEPNKLDTPTDLSMCVTLDKQGPIYG